MKEKAYFAGGCFWGVEYHFQNLDGVISTSVGFMGGNIDSPSYEEVCEKGTGHAEAVEVIFDPARIKYDEIAKLFFEIHDPTQVDRQGPDIGDQYRSEIFYTSEEQRQASQKLIKTLEGKGLKVATKLTPAGKFWKAENYHQKYYQKNGHEPYCHIRKKRF